MYIVHRSTCKFMNVFIYIFLNIFNKWNIWGLWKLDRVWEPMKFDEILIGLSLPNLVCGARLNLLTLSGCGSLRSVNFIFRHGTLHGDQGRVSRPGCRLSWTWNLNINMLWYVVHDCVSHTANMFRWVKVWKSIKLEVYSPLFSALTEHSAQTWS